MVTDVQVNSFVGTFHDDVNHRMSDVHVNSFEGTFHDDVTHRMSGVQVNSFVGAFHDAVILYALALNESLEAGVSISNGSEITRRMWNRTFDGEYRTRR